MSADEDVLHGLVVSGSSASGALIGASLTTLANYADSMSVTEMDALAGGTISLIASALRQIFEPQRKSDGHVLASFANVRRFIDTNPASPALETDKLAGNFGLSRASFYRLFAPVGGVAAYIRRERLRHVFRDISAAEHANVRLAGLARRWGFKDTSTFNRAFIQTFGISPGEARAAALAAPQVVVSKRPPMQLRSVNGSARFARRDRRPTRSLSHVVVEFRHTKGELGSNP